MPFFILSIISSTAFAFVSVEGVESQRVRKHMGAQVNGLLKLNKYFFLCFHAPTLCFNLRETHHFDRLSWLYFCFSGFEECLAQREQGHRGQIVILGEEFFCCWSVKSNHIKLRLKLPIVSTGGREHTWWQALLVEEEEVEEVVAVEEVVEVVEEWLSHLVHHFSPGLLYLGTVSLWRNTGKQSKR